MLVWKKREERSETGGREMKGERWRCGGDICPGGGRMRQQSRGRYPAPPPSMNRHYVPKSVLPVTSWLLNNGTALGVT